MNGSRHMEWPPDGDYMTYYSRFNKYYAPKLKQNKYGNEKRTYNGIKFDSVAEMKRYIVLSDMEKHGEISNLRMQVPFELLPGFTINGHKQRAIKYVADFVYTDPDGKEHIEDVKGVETKEYCIKRKLMAYQGHLIEEPNKPKQWWDNSKK